MLKTSILLVLVLVLHVTGCRNPEVTEVERALSFDPVVAPDTSEFIEHWRKGKLSACYNEGRDQVLVRDESSGHGLRISRFPARLGRIIATGWDAQSGERFFVHLSLGPDAGTMLYLDLEAREVLEVKHWSAW